VNANAAQRLQDSGRATAAYARLRLSGWLFAADVGLGLADKRVGMSGLICSLSIRTTMMQR
jgi:hypothetical protein